MARFSIRWKHGMYRVSIPNYDGGEVVTVDEYARLEAENAELRKDKERLDWLEGEIGREPAVLNLDRPVRSLFRRNMPITRATIDAETAQGAEG